MKIINGMTSFDLERHARELLKYKEKAAREDGTQAPIGVAVHAAKFPHSCDDCGDTYWDTDKWGGCHIGCRGTLKKAGF